MKLEITQRCFEICFYSNVSSEKDWTITQQLDNFYKYKWLKVSNSTIKHGKHSRINILHSRNIKSTRLLKCQSSSEVRHTKSSCIIVKFITREIWNSTFPNELCESFIFSQNLIEMVPYIKVWEEGALISVCVVNWLNICKHLYCHLLQF